MEQWIWEIIEIELNRRKTLNQGNLTGGSTVLSLLLIILFCNYGFSKDWFTSWVELVGEGKLGKWSFLRCYLQALGSRRSRCLRISWRCYSSMQQTFRIQVQYTLSYEWSAQVKWSLYRRRQTYLYGTYKKYVSWWDTQLLLCKVYSC